MGITAYYPREKESIYPREVDAAAWQVLESHLSPKVKFIIGTDLPDPADYDVLITGRPSEAQLTASPNLRAVLVPWAGVPLETAEMMKAYPHISVHNLHHNAVTTAESALTLLFAAAKQVVPIDRRFRQHDWRPRYAPNPAVMLHGKTILILGYGHIGQHIGKVCAAMGMQVIATRRSLKALEESDPWAAVYPASELHSLLPQANVLVVTLPLTDETTGLIGEAELALLPQNAIVVNVGRGPIIEQGALYQAVKSGHLHSAGLDVWYNYPTDEASRAHTPPADYPFHELENVVMSPHRGGGASDVEILRMQHLAEVLNKAAQGEDMPNKINLERGY